jgi:hypothetical protein
VCEYVALGNRVLRTVFEPRTVQIAVQGRKVLNVELHHFYTFSLVTSVIKLAGVRLNGDVARNRRFIIILVWNPGTIWKS